MEFALVSFQAKAAEASTPEELNGHLRDAAKAFGLTTHAAGRLVPYDRDNPFVLNNWPKAWLELYAARGFGSEDIAVAHALRSPEPLTWTEIKVRYPGASVDIFAATAEFGWTEGFVVPVHGPGAKRAVVSFAGDGRPLRGTAKQAMELIALFAYERAVELLEGARAGEALTPREREVLALIAVGKSDGEMAADLGVSKATTHFHAENARKKLQAATRAHAVALAITRGLVRL